MSSLESGGFSRTDLKKHIGALVRMLTFGPFPMASSAQSIPGYQVTGAVCAEVWTLTGKRRTEKAQTETTFMED